MSNAVLLILPIPSITPHKNFFGRSAILPSGSAPLRQEIEEPVSYIYIPRGLPNKSRDHGRLQLVSIHPTSPWKRIRKWPHPKGLIFFSACARIRNGSGKKCKSFKLRRSSYFRQIEFPTFLGREREHAFLLQKV